ncbi:hypothetical protein AYO44_02510 [Planctomycetaceae bacterium SCGC AG-212-F19]|nr:hypothetical protein AYO44_02510 [Planctomycetaceae bacterium SCGC AG-212-F19]
MPVKKSVDLLKKDLEKAKAAIGETPPNVKTAMLQVDYGLAKLVNVEKDYLAMKKKDFGPKLKKVEANIEKIKGIIEKEPDRIQAFVQLKNVIKEIDVVEKGTKKD